jgi:hypothetical protein
MPVLTSIAFSTEHVADDLAHVDEAADAAHDRLFRSKWDSTITTDTDVSYSHAGRGGGVPPPPYWLQRGYVFRLPRHASKLPCRTIDPAAGCRARRSFAFADPAAIHHE